MEIIDNGATYTFCQTRFHVVAVFYDDGKDFCVVKHWNKYRKYWVYEIATAEFVEDKLKRKKNGRKS